MVEKDESKAQEPDETEKFVTKISEKLPGQIMGLNSCSIDNCVTNSFD